MNKFKAYYFNKSTIIEATSQYDAVKKAREYFKASKKNQHMVHCTIIEEDGKQVIHSTAGI